MSRGIFVNRDGERGERFKEERKRLGLTQGAAAEIAGVSREMFARYETGSMPGNAPLGKMMMKGFDTGYILSGRRKEDLKEWSRSKGAVVITAPDGGKVVHQIPSQRGLSWREAMELVLDVLHENGKSLPGVAVTSIVDAVMAWQRAGATVDKAAVMTQLKVVK